MATQDSQHDERLLAGAVMTLSEDARWEAYDLVARRGVTEAVDLLRGHSGELALSWSAFDQLFALALDQAAAALAGGAAIPRVDVSAYLVPCPLPPETLAGIRARAAALTSEELGSLSAHVRTVTDRGDGRRLSRNAVLVMQQRATLNRRLWPDARLTLGVHDRALMLAGVEAFERGALAIGPTPLWHRLLLHWLS